MRVMSNEVQRRSITGKGGRVRRVPRLAGLMLIGGLALAAVGAGPAPAAPAVCANFTVGTADGESISLTAANDAYDGGGGGDNISGLDGDDCLLGSGGNDNLQGGTGDDNLQGGAGGDTILGGDGADDITGGAGGDTVLAGGGDDTVDAYDANGGEVVSCGSGVDTVYADKTDRVMPDCENVVRAPRV